VDAKTHWEKVYATKAPETVSWYRPHLETFACSDRARCSGYSAFIIDVWGSEIHPRDDSLHAATKHHRPRCFSNRYDVTKKRWVGAEQVQWLVADVTRAELSNRAYDCLA